MTGRDRQVAGLTALLRQERLVTLTGLPGVGKNAVASAAARAVVRAAAARGTGAGAYWRAEVPLDGVSDPRLVPHSVAYALSAPDDFRLSCRESLIRALAPRRALIVLQDCDHLLGAVAEFALAVLAACPRVGLLVTSRRSLGMPRERVAVLPPLARQDSVDLFLDRARRAAPPGPGAEVRLPARDTVDRLCARLDDLPLAIVSAARNLPHASPEDLAGQAERLCLDFGPYESPHGSPYESSHESPYGSSRGGAYGSPREGAYAGEREGPYEKPTGTRRHETLGVAIRHSHDLCTPEQRLLWARFSELDGDVGYEKIVAHCADETLPASDALTAAADLADHSLLVRADRATRDRAAYRMPFTIRAYGSTLPHGR